MNPFDVVRQFEAALCEYTGAKYAVTTTSCTSALLLACKWHLRVDTQPIEIPRRTYCSVPMSVLHAGGSVKFRDEDWSGAYQLKPYPIWDSARWFTSGLWNALKGFVCVSFHASKTLGIEQGGAILHSDDGADSWLRKMRFDGRAEGVHPSDDNFEVIGYHCYLSPSVAAQGLLKLHSLPRDNEHLPNDNYPDLSRFPIFL